ncbi:unnamed protein product [Phytomonas sp. Hart1]|nr:unnamed protein product [Phytomonas sp. Hart1]|eukprot:CCW68666.1 unnamed protein product [Phytomonas sp. isolate Hart1]
MYRATALQCRGVKTSKLLRTMDATLLVCKGLTTSTGAQRKPSCVTPVGVLTTQRPSGLYSGPLFQCFYACAPISPGDRCTLCTPRRTFMANLFRRSSPKVKVDDLVYDTESTRYRGTIFGLPADIVVFNFKIFACIVTIFSMIYIFLKGIRLFSHFSSQTVARMGFVSGFGCCIVAYTAIFQVIRRLRINTNAVYNHSIALVMKNPRVQELLGQNPRAGTFKAYGTMGGLKLPLLRRIRSGSYEFSDLLGLKPRRLQMVFVLKAPSEGREAVIYCDVHKESKGFMMSENVYKSLAVTLIETSTKERETVMVIGNLADVPFIL